jgi:hypothetical protein
MNEYPILENAALVDGEQVARYLDMMFGHVEWGDQAFGIRGIGEAETPKAGLFREPLWFLPERCSIAEETYKAAVRWGQFHVATFVIPAVMTPDCLSAREGTREHIAAFTTILVDIDSGDTDAKLEWCRLNVGPPTMVVFSGGTTSEGKPKRHVYWRLTEPTEEVDRVAEIRQILAAKVGGDFHFKNAPQVIRVPGSIHAKGGVRSMCRIESEGGGDYDLDELAESIDDALPMAGVEYVSPTPLLSHATNGAMDFSGGAGASKGVESTNRALMSDVHAGGEGDQTRWGNFNQVAGWNIRLARERKQTLDEAGTACYGWMLQHMKPVWSDARFKAEFDGQVKNDIKANGPMPYYVAAMIPESLGPTRHEKFDSTKRALMGYDIGQWATGAPPARRHLVHGLIMAGQTHVLAAEGGAGKTFLCMDLCLRLAASGNRTDPDADPVLWMGQPVTDEAAGGTVIMLTAEDAKEELHIRLRDIDEDGSLRAAAAGRFRILPLLDMGGAFPLVTHDANKVPVPSARWLEICASIAEVIAEGGRISAIVMDTLASTLHGEDVSGSVVTEYFNEVSRVASMLDCAFVITHHVRKGSDQNPIKTLEDMKSAIRGSTAVIGSARVVLGFWHANDFRRKLEGLGITPERNRVYYAGVCKANNPEMFVGTKTLLRHASGLLGDVSGQVVPPDQIRAERMAWLVLAVRKAAHDRYPLTKTNANGLFTRRKQLPPPLRNLPRAEFDRLTDMAMEGGLIVRGALANKGASSGYLDVPGGPIDRKQGYQEDGVWTPRWEDYEYDQTIQEVVMATDG